jgi:hypothetical protein
MRSKRLPYEIEIIRLEARPIAVVRRRARPVELSTVVPAACGEVWKHVRAAEVKGAGRHVAVYLDGQITLEVGVEVPSTFVGSGDVFLSATPAGAVARTVHMGPIAFCPAPIQRSSIGAPPRTFCSPVRTGKSMVIGTTIRPN